MSEHNWQFSMEARVSWELMLADILSARVSIDLEQYIFSPDRIGSKFLSALKQKAQEGIKVRLLVDAVGGRHLTSKIINDFKRDNIEFISFNPISPWRLDNFTSWFLRDHRKMLIIDSEIAHIGSLGVSDDMEFWRDAHVRLTGEIVNGIKSGFEKMWLAAKQNLKWSKFPPIRGLKGFSFLTTSPSLRGWHIRDAYIEMIRNAKSYIYLATPYFVPDLGFFRALRLAAKRGVEVKLLIPSFSDHRSIDIASASYLGLSMKSGIKVYRYPSKKFFHAKYAVIDDEWATIGSVNLDNLSFRYNHEANIVSTNHRFALDLKEYFLQDMEISKQVSHSDWEKRPFTQRVLEALTWPIHNFF